MRACGLWLRSLNAKFIHRERGACARIGEDNVGDVG